MKRSMIKFLAAILIFSGSVVNANANEVDRADNEKSATVSSIVMQDFTKNFPNISEVVWTTAGKQTFGYFHENGVPVRVIYNKKGKLVYTIRYFSDSQVPSTIAGKVSNAGYDLHIAHVTEIKTRFSVCHLVKLENEHSIVTVLVGANGDTTVYEELTKG